MNFSRLSIRHQLVIIVLIVAIPAILVIYSYGKVQRSNDIDNAKLITQKISQRIVSQQETIAASTNQLFIALSKLPEIKHRDVAQTRTILSEILKQSPYYSNLFVADASGIVWASAIHSGERVSVADRRYFINALASGNLSSGEYHIARISQKPTLSLGYPLRDDSGETTDVLVAGISLDYMRAAFEPNTLPNGASFAVLDHKGIVLTRAIDPGKYMGKPSNPEVFQEMLAGPDEETSIGTSSVVGDNRIQTYRKLRLPGETNPYMYVRVGIPTGTVLSESSSNLLTSLAAYALALAVAVFLSWRFARVQIINKVMALQESSRRLADGHLDTKVSHEVQGGELGKLGQTFDAMAEKLAEREQALREREKNYRDIFNTTHDALFVNDTSGNIIEANRTACSMFGYAREELIGTSAGILMEGKPPHTPADAALLLEKSFKEGPQEFEWLCKRKTGELFWAEIAIISTNASQGMRALAVVRDISERKEIEKMKDALLSNISHEMRTPLTSMLGFLEFVIENELDAEQTRDYHATMYKETVRLNEMITNYLDMQKLKSNLYQYVFKRIIVDDLLDTVAAIFASPVSKRTIVIDKPEHTLAVSGDEDLLHQAFSNLLSNAMKYSQEGSTVTFGAKHEGSTVLFWVEDEGTGIPENALDKVFDMFYRVEGTTKRKVAGTGLGLALVKRIVDAHGGRVWAQSAMGKGSTFYVSLPVDNPLSEANA